MDTSVHYDVILCSIKESVITIEKQGNTLILPSFPNLNRFLNDSIGKIGVVNYVSEHVCWRFTPYLDQSLRRVYEADTGGYLGWRCNAKPFTWLASSEIIPGKNGNFIEDEAEELTIKVPPEFFDLCERLKQSPEIILRGFIADACELFNIRDCPREDGYTSNGSDERRLADEYLERIYGIYDEEEKD